MLPSFVVFQIFVSQPAIFTCPVQLYSAMIGHLSHMYRQPDHAVVQIFKKMPLLADSNTSI